MGGGETMIAAGLGFSERVSSEEIVQIIRQAESQCGVAVDMVAIPEFKGLSAALQQALNTLRLPLLRISRQVLQDVQPLCPTVSLRASAATGLASVAEACALAAVAEPRRLLLQRISSECATCAIASEAFP
jgi:cobalt-precorrin 5A hydrolase